MLVNYSFTDMGCFDDYSDADPGAQTRKGNGITAFLLYVSRYITFRQTNIFTAKLIAKASLKYFTTSPNFQEARKRFNYESGKSKALQKKTIVLQCYITIIQRITIIHDNLIDFNENIYVFKYLNEVPPSDD